MTGLKVLYVHGANQGGQQDVIRELNDALVRGFRKAESPLTPTDLELSVGYYKNFLDGLKSNNAEPGETLLPVAPGGLREVIDCPCCTKGFGYTVYGAALNALPVSKHVMERVIGLLVPEVRLYVKHEPLREAILTHITEQIDGIQPDVVVGHSLGSVVALDALARARVAAHPRLM